MLVSCIKVSMIVFNFVLCMIGLTVGINAILLYTNPRIGDEVVIYETGTNVKLDVDLGIGHNDKVLIGAAVFGFGVFVVSFYGCIGAACDSICALATYIVLVIAVLVGCLGVGAASFHYMNDISVGVFSSKLAQLRIQRLIETRHNDTKAMQELNGYQIRWSCCGCYNSTDYATGGVPQTCKDNVTGEIHLIGCCKKKAKDLAVEVQTGFMTVGLMMMVGVVIELMAIVFALVAIFVPEKVVVTTVSQTERTVESTYRSRWDPRSWVSRRPRPRSPPRHRPRSPPRHKPPPRPAGRR